MYPLLLHSPCKSRLWGGNRISSLLKSEEYEKAAELWLLSGNSDGESTVKNGKLKDYTVGQVFETYGKRIGGQAYNPDMPFPALIKLIDAKDSLPLGVSTKERVIYVADAESDAQIICGFSRDVSKDEIRQRVLSNTIFPVCDFLPVKKGDIIVIPKGNLFAVGKGVLCCEISHGDEEFFAVSDYGRTDKNGNRLTLNTNEALRILRLEKSDYIKVGADDTFLYPFGTINEMPLNAGLSASLVHLCGSMGISEDNSFVSAIITDGTAALSYPSGTINLKTYDSVVIPAGMNVKFTGYADILCTHL